MVTGGHSCAARLQVSQHPAPPTTTASSSGLERDDIIVAERLPEVPISTIGRVELWLQKCPSRKQRGHNGGHFSSVNPLKVL